MAAGVKNHAFHILPPDPYPILTAFSAMATTGGGVFWMHKIAAGKWVSIAGLIALVFFAGSWWKRIRDEAQAGDHTPIVQLHLRYGMILFIASEVMFFVAWFWAFFSSALYPHAADPVGGVWPPKGIEVLDPFVFPLLNTMILLLSGTTVTWAHHALIHGDRQGLKQGLWITVGLGLAVLRRCRPTSTATPSSVSRATSTARLSSWRPVSTASTSWWAPSSSAVCLWRAYVGDFTPRQHFGFEAAAWYWHFVDVVWLFLFLSIYIWGSNFGAAVAEAAGA